MRLGTVDPSSFSEPEKILTKHVDLDWTVDFDKKIIEGSATYTFEIITKELNNILLDVRDVKIKDVFALVSGNEIPLNFFIDNDVKDIGSKLTLELPTGSEGILKIRIRYQTDSKASALQWLTAEQTMGKKNPYLFSQCQAIHARSLLPCQDTPSVKFTYKAKLKYPEGLTGLMSAICVRHGNGEAEFDQSVPIPSYLLAITVGKLVSKPLGDKCSVWSEAEIIDKCAEEFSETEQMLKAAESICGPYVWHKYDLLVMPPSFPYGGMENPCLTFVTPTLLAGDKSLADVVAHEIAHSWTGNLVTNKNFEHFWLNEGFTVFVETKIIGRLKSNKDKDLRCIGNLTELQQCINVDLADTPQFTKLVVDLTNNNPDDAFSTVPYNKGSTFLRYIEDLVGGPEVFETFLQFYLNKYKYQSILTNDFKETLYDYFITNDSSKMSALNSIDWDRWLYGEGMPPVIPKYDDTLAVVFLQIAHNWCTKTVKELKNTPEILQTISSQQLISFLSKLIECNDIVDFNEEKVKFLESTYKLATNNNSEVRFRYLRLCIRAHLMDKMDDILAFANSNFRMKFVRPIYRDLAKWPEAKPIAIDNFNKVKDQMMTVCSYGIKKDLGLS